MKKAFMRFDDFLTRFPSLRERTNRIFAPIRRRILIKNGGDKSFTIISNNCWAGHVYRYFGLPYQTPTVGLFFFSRDYIKFIQNLRYYLSLDLHFISSKESRYRDWFSTNETINCPIGVLDDVEVVFLHYKSQEEAEEKWERRKQRIDWEHLYFKMAEQNECSYDDMKEFDSLPYSDKFIFVSKNYGFDSQVIQHDYDEAPYVLNDTLHFIKYIDVINWLSHRPFKKKQ